MSAAMRILSVLVLSALALRIISFGFLPPDDALRHAAKPISGKSWPEIMVMRPDITIDHNPGWHWILTRIYRLSGWDATGLVRFSVVSMFLAFALSPIPRVKRGETWLAALAVVMAVFPYFALRAFVGRPLLITMGVTLALLCLWRSKEKGERQGVSVRAAVSIILIALATWVHGSWYLIVLLPVMFFAAQQWRTGLILAFCWSSGVLLGAVLTGEPWTFLSQSARFPFIALGENASAQGLVGEFQRLTLPDTYPFLAIVAVLLVWRKAGGHSLRAVLRDPVFWMAAGGCVLGFRVIRFWLDWGLPALVLWVALQLEERTSEKIAENSWVRPAIACLSAAILIGLVGNDRGSRWSIFGKFEALDARRPEHKDWLPDPGGILYDVNLSVFYQTFFTNPRGDWRYALGFEPTFMRADNFAVYKELWSTRNAIRACAPWVKKMTPADRLVLIGGPEVTPAIPELEWKYVIYQTWVGRVPRGKAN